MQIDFNTPLLSLSGQPIMTNRRTEKQQKALRRVEAKGHLTDDDLDALEKLEEAVRKTPVTLGEVCVKALMGQAKVKEHDGQQLLSRTMLATKIAGDYEVDEGTGLYGTVDLSDKKAALIVGLVQEGYVQSPLIYARVYSLLRGRDQDDLGDEE